MRHRSAGMKRKTSSIGEDFFIRNPSATTIPNEINFILINFFFSHSPSSRARSTIPDIFSVDFNQSHGIMVGNKSKKLNERSGETEIGSLERVRKKIQVSR